MSDILTATGLAKGGLYGNFDSKEEIARETFKYSFEKAYSGVVAAAATKESPFEKLIAICDYYKDYTRNSPIDGGCPILNYSIEADDTMPRLKRDVKLAMERQLNDLCRVMEKGKRLGEIRKDINSEKYAALIYSQIEGAIFLSKALDDHKKLNQSLEFLKSLIINDLKA